jgi:hypothetical protein
MGQMAVAHMQGVGNLPQMASAAYSSTTYDGMGNQGLGLYQPAINTAGLVGLQQGSVNTQIIRAMNQQPAKVEEKMTEQKRRLVKVIIIDPDDRVPLDKCVLHSGSEKLTDLTDQELFFEIDIKTILDAHNTTRVSIVDKTIKERREHLEPVKVRDLRMVVVTVAAF